MLVTIWNNNIADNDNLNDNDDDEDDNNDDEDDDDGGDRSYFLSRKDCQR